MNYQIRSKTRLIQSLLNMQEGVQEFTEFVEMGEDALNFYASNEEKPTLIDSIEKDRSTLKAFKLTFNNLLKTIKLYEVEE